MYMCACVVCFCVFVYVCVLCVNEYMCVYVHVSVLCSVCLYMRCMCGMCNVCV
jgi:hypothetical protein